MIADSVPWKDDLGRIASDIERQKTQRRWSERSMYLFERNVMTAAYSIRKLIEARRVSDTLARRSWPVKRYRRTGPVPDGWNRWEPEELYDLNSPESASLSTLELCHQIVHSYMFFPVWNWDESTRRPRRQDLTSLCFVGDRRRTSHLYAIDIDDLIALVFTVGDEDVIEVEMRPNADGERWITKVVGVGRGDPRHRSATS